MEESKSFRGEGGGRGCPAEMAVSDILEGVQSEVGRILKADATAIPTVRGGGGGWGVGLGVAEDFRTVFQELERGA